MVDINAGDRALHQQLGWGILCWNPDGTISFVPDSAMLTPLTFTEAEFLEQFAVWAGQRRRYKIVRHYFKGGARVIKSGLTLEQAQAHCANPETSSSTCKLAHNVRRTREMGQWFDGYSEE